MSQLFQPCSIDLQLRPASFDSATTKQREQAIRSAVLAWTSSISESISQAGASSSSSPGTVHSVADNGPFSRLRLLRADAESHVVHATAPAYAVDQWVDCLNANLTTASRAVVTAIRLEALRVHYDGLSAAMDEWIPMPAGKSSRVALFGTWTSCLSPEELKGPGPPVGANLGAGRRMLGKPSMEVDRSG